MTTDLLTEASILKALMAFSKELDVDPELSKLTQAAQNPDEIITIAASRGHRLSKEYLRRMAFHLANRHFPWCSKGDEGRRAFFK